jgi:hypothetical protein
MFSEVSDEGEPPGFADAADKEGPLDFELLLGFYEADARRITCFQCEWPEAFEPS